MKRQRPAATWIVDYSAARAHAIRWLGDRYLLARPINRSHYRPRPPGPDLSLAAPTGEPAARGAIGINAAYVIPPDETNLELLKRAIAWRMYE